MPFTNESVNYCNECFDIPMNNNNLGKIFKKFVYTVKQNIIDKILIDGQILKKNPPQIIFVIYFTFIKIPWLF